MKYKLHVVGLVAAALLTRAATARADQATVDPAEIGGSVDPGASGDIDDDGTHVVTAASVAALEMALPASWSWLPVLYYLLCLIHQKLDSISPSCMDKFTFRSFRFDTSPFHVIAIRHPLSVLGDYQIARSNGFGAGGATLFACLTGAFWEFFV